MNPTPVQQGVETTLPELRFLGPVHEGIPVRDLEASLKFYTEVLGLNWE